MTEPSSRFFQKLVEHSSDSFTVLDESGKRVYQSPQVEGLLGFGAKQFLAESPLAGVHPDDLAKVKQALEDVRVSDESRVVRVEYRKLHANGSYVHIEAAVRNLMAHPDVRGVVVNARDISTTHRMRDALQASQARYELAMRASRGALWEWDVPTGAVTWSAELKAQLGYAEDEIEASLETAAELQHPDDAPRVREALLAHMERGVPLEVDERLRCKDGQYRWFCLMGTAIQREGERTVRSIGVQIDIHERKTAEIRLRTSEQMFRALFEGTSAAVTLRDIDRQHLIDCNSAALKFYGCETKEELFNTTPLALSPPHQADGRPSMEVFRDVVANAMRDGSHRLEWLYRRKDTGAVFLADVRITVIELHDGRKVMQTMLEDITEKKQLVLVLAKAKEEAIAASVAKSSFLANMSHELRTPLNGVIGMVDLLGTTSLDDKQRRYAEIAGTSANLLLSVINDILDFSKIEAGKLELEAIEFAFSEVVEDVANILELGAEAKGLDLTCESEGALGTVVGDPARIRQVLVNLVSNAIKFTTRGEVSVRASLVAALPAATRVRVEVTDTGVGISPDAQATLFRPFTQADSSTARHYGGTGLGLAISKQLIDRMGGSIGVRSEVNRGSTFWFELELGKPLEPRPLDVTHEPRLSGLRVLGVDDNATNRELLRAHLTEAGMLCDTAADGPTALRMLEEALARAPYALLILDHHMPVMDGRELARRVRADARLRGVRVVMLGSVARPLDAAEQEALGIVSYSTKPIWRKQLLRALAAALDHGVDASSQLATGERGAANILIVEDNPINAEVASEILRSAGYVCDVVEDGAAAIRAAQEKSYDLILMDCQLPGIDGYEATRVIREHSAVPIVALTASVTKEDLERCKAAGMNAHLSKPVDARQLVATIGQYMKAH